MIVLANTDYYKLQQLKTMGKTHEIPKNPEGSFNDFCPSPSGEVSVEVRESIPRLGHEAT